MSAVLWYNECSGVVVSNKSIILGRDVKSIFFQEMSQINNLSVNKLHDEILFYSSGVIETYMFSEKYFDMTEGKVREKTLGQRLLESNLLYGNAKERAFQDIGETSLVLCGVFRNSVKKKLVDLSFYKNIGQNAFTGLNNFRPYEFNTHDFYQKISENFHHLSNLIYAVSNKLMSENEEELLGIKIKTS